MVNGVSAILAVIQKDVLGLKKAVDFTTGGFTRMKVAVAGMAFVGFGSGILYGMNALSKAGEKWESQLVQIKNAGFSVEEQTLAIAAANRTSSQVMTTTPTENLKAIGELRYALASGIKGGTPEQKRLRATQEAIELLPEIQKAQATINSTLGSEKHGSDVYEMAKALEDIGATQDKARFSKLLQGMVVAAIAQQGRLTATDWFQSIKYTRGAGMGYSDEFIMMYLPTLMQELKTGKGSGQGGGAGNPLNTLYQILVGGHIGSKAALTEYMKFNLLRPGMLTTTTTGSPKGVLPGGIKGADAGQLNPYFWVRDYLLPAFKNAGIVDPAKQRQEIAVMFPGRVGQQIVQMMTMVNKMESDRILIEGSEKMEPAYQRAAREDPKIVREELAKQWDRVTTDLGKPLTKLKIRFFYELARGLSWLADAIERHPQRAALLIKLIGAIGLMFTVMGGIAVFAAAVAAMGGLAFVGTGIALMAFGSAIAYVLSLVNWDDVRKWARGIRQWATDATDTVVGWLKHMWEHILGVARNAAHWVVQIVASFKQDMLNVWTAMTEALANFVRRLRAFVASIAGSLYEGLRSGPADMQPGGVPLPGPRVTPGAFRMAPQHSGPATIQNVIYLDTHVIARSTTKLQSRWAERAPAGTNRIDHRISPLYPSSLVPT